MWQLLIIVQTFWSGNRMWEDSLGFLDLDGRTDLKQILNQQILKMDTTSSGKFPTGRGELFLSRQ